MGNRITLYVRNEDVETAREDATFNIDTMSDSEVEDHTEVWLDEIYGRVNICGYEMDAGTALRRMDEIAFREAVLSVIDADFTEVEVPWDVYVTGDETLQTTLRRLLDAEVNEDEDES